MSTSRALVDRSRRQRRRRTVVEIAALLEEMRQGGLSQRAFAHSRGIPLSTLGYWLRRDAESASAPEPPASRLVPVTISPPGPWDSGAAEMIEVTLRTGDVLRLPGQFDDSALRRLLRILEERC